MSCESTKILACKSIKGNILGRVGPLQHDILGRAGLAGLIGDHGNKPIRSVVYAQDMVQATY